MTTGVLVVGAINVDLVVAADRLPGPGETVVGATMQRHGGGKGANAAVAAARAGASVRYCGAVGADPTGEEALAELRREGVDVADVAVVEGVATGAALIVVDPSGENQIAVGVGANAAVEPAAVRAAVARAAGWAGCVLVSTEIAPEAVAAAVQASAAAGMRCIVNPAPVIVELVDLLPLCELVTPNAGELRDLHGMLTGAPSATVEQMAVELGRRTAGGALVTRGGDGALVVDEDGAVTSIAAGFVAEVKDATGAGDTFNGVLAGALAGGASAADAAIRAVTAASLSVSAVGARSGMPTRARIDEALAAGV